MSDDRIDYESALVSAEVMLKLVRKYAHEEGDSRVVQAADGARLACRRSLDALRIRARKTGQARQKK